MGERVIWIKGFVPKTAPTIKAPYAAVDFPLAVAEIDPSRTSVAAAVSLPDARRYDGRELRMEIIEHGGKLWRPMMHRQEHGEAPLPAEEALLRKDDNPVAKAARRHYRQSVADDASEGNGDPAKTTELAAEIAEAARQVCIVDGVAYRECHEPTWIVTGARFMTSGVLLQPFLGVPGQSRSSVWFSHDRLAEAETYAAEIAAERGTEVVLRGSIDVAGNTVPAFDDVTFAEERVLKAFSHDVRLLAGSIPEEVYELAAEARRMVDDDRHAAVQACFRVAASLSGVEGNVAVDALMSAARMPLSQADYFRRHAVFGRSDDEALDSISSFPMP